MTDWIPEPEEPKRLADIENWIPLDECRHGHLYQVECRNAQFGYFDEEKDGFWIARVHLMDGVFIQGDSANEFEAGDRYPFLEYHWDVGSNEIFEPSGTAKPLREITDAPILVLPDQLGEAFKFLKRCPNRRAVTGFKHREDLEFIKKRLKEREDDET